MVASTALLLGTAGSANAAVSGFFRDSAWWGKADLTVFTDLIGARHYVTIDAWVTDSAGHGDSYYEGYLVRVRAAFYKWTTSRVPDQVNYLDDGPARGSTSYHAIYNLGTFQKVELKLCRVLVSRNAWDCRPARTVYR